MIRVRGLGGVFMRGWMGNEVEGKGGVMANE